MRVIGIVLPFVDFELRTEVIVIGLVTGLTYALLGLGLTVVYKTTRVLNFAHGEMGALPAILVPVLAINNNWNYWLALPAAIAASAAIGFAMEATVIRRLRNASRLVVLVATIGAAQLLFLINLLLPKGGDLGGSRYPVPFDIHFDIGSIRLGTGQLMILALVPFIAAGLVSFFRNSRIGKASRAVAENEEVARLAGVPVRRVAQAVWLLAGLLAGVSAILIGPTRPIETQAALGPALLVRGLGAAMLGGLTNLPAVFGGGIAIGVIEALVIWNYPVGGVLEMVLFGIILLSLLLQPRLRQQIRGGEGSSYSLAGRIRGLHPRLARHPRVMTARRTGIAAALVVGFLLPLPFDNSQRFFLTSVVVFAVMGLSLVVLTGFAGQVSLGQFAFVTVGAVVGGRLHQLGYPHLTGLLYAVLAGGLVAFFVGLPALRLRGLFLAVATLGFAVASSSWVFNQDWLVHSEAGVTSLRLPRPTWLGIDFESELRYYWLSLFVLVLVAAAVQRLRRSGIGRAFIAVRDNEPTASTFSLSPSRVKLTAFVVSGAIASLGGYFYAGLLVNYAHSPGTTTFAPDESLSLVAMVVFGGVTTITGALLGAFWVQGMPHVFGENIGLLSSGLGLLVVLLIVPGGLASLAFTIRDRLAELLAGETPQEAERTELVVEKTFADIGDLRAAVDAAPAGSMNGDTRPLVAENVTVRFGGNQVLTDVSVHANRAEIVGLMGPNGAGKTTLFDVLTGQVRPVSGAVLLHGEEISHLPPQARARLGLGRSYQQARLFDDLTVVETLQVALERQDPSEAVPSLLGLPPSRVAESAKRRKAHELVELLGLEAYSHRTASELPTGTRRFLELGAVIAMGADVMLLDEPTAGFAQHEVEAFQPVLRRIRDELGATMVVVDHDVPMMAELVDRLYVLVTGEVIAKGPPQLLRDNEDVARAYLGSDERAIERSGRRVSERTGARRRPKPSTAGGRA